MEFNFKNNLFKAFEEPSGVGFSDADAAMLELAGLYPITPTEADGMRSYDEQFAVSLNYNTNAIEGSTLTLADTAMVLDGEALPADKEARFIYAAKGVHDATEYTKMLLAKGGTALTQDTVKNIHEFVAQDLPIRLRGVYRTSPVSIRGSNTVASPVLRIRDHMDDLLYAYSESNLHPIERASSFHAFFENIHPFQDGNGRTGRIVLNLMLQADGYRPIVIKGAEKARYYEALENWQVRGCGQPFVEMVKDAALSELRTCIEIINEARSAAESGRL